jgi:hypothetical protein
MLFFNKDFLLLSNHLHSLNLKVYPQLHFIIPYNQYHVKIKKILPVMQIFYWISKIPQFIHDDMKHIYQISIKPMKH